MSSRTRPAVLQVRCREMLRDDYLKPDNWDGSFYELAIEYVPRGDDAQLARALAALWAGPALRGPWPERKQFGNAGAVPERLEADSTNRLYGLVDLPEHGWLGCGSHIVREHEERGSDWLVLFIPMGMLELVLPVEYPLIGPHNPWLTTLDAALLAVAEDVYQAAPFELALIGEEASGTVTAHELEAGRHVEGGTLLSPRLFEAVRPATDSVRLASGLWWFPLQV